MTHVEQQSHAPVINTPAHVSTRTARSGHSFARRLSWLLSVASEPLPSWEAVGQTSAQVTTREPGERRLGKPKPVANEALKDLQFAWLSEAAYGNTPAGMKRRESVVLDQETADCPNSQTALSAAGWKPWPNFPNDGLLRRIEKFHLRVEVWTRAEPPQVAVAFGGTVFNNMNDWIANLRWFLPKHDDEYTSIVKVLGPAFVQEYRQRLLDPEWGFLKSAKIYATGHSLGGGLAQQFAYSLSQDGAAPRVSQVFAFDPSPVTGFYSVRKRVRDENRKGLKIDRIYERGEVLAILRSLTSFIYPPSKVNPSIRAVRYSLFYTTNPIAGHSMKVLACKLNVAAGCATKFMTALGLSSHNGPQPSNRCVYRTKALFKGMGRAMRRLIVGF
jgi:hypothetical protein